MKHFDDDIVVREEDEVEYRRAEDPILESIEEDEKYAKEVEKFGADLLFFSLRVHFWHLNADRNAVHVTLRDLYESLDDKADALLEAVSGLLDKEIALPKVDFGSVAWKKDSCIKEIVGVKKKAESLVKGTDGGVDNILGDICEFCDSAIYKLRRL